MKVTKIRTIINIKAKEGYDMPRTSRSGFTLIELMITIAVLAILAAIALPSFQGTLERRQLVGAAENLYADLQYTRSEAIKRNQNIRFHVEFDGTDWCYGVDDDAGVDCDCFANECEIENVVKNTSSAEYKNIQLLDSESIEFTPRQGMPTLNETYTFRIGADGTEKSVVVNPVGSIRMSN